MCRTLFASPVHPLSPGAVLVDKGFWPLSHSTPPMLIQSCCSLATPAFPLRGGGRVCVLASPLSPAAFAATPLQFCHFRKGPSVRTSASEPFTFSGVVCRVHLSYECLPTVATIIGFPEKVH